MDTTLATRIHRLLCGLVLLSLGACSGDDGAAGAAGQPGTPGVATSSNATTITVAVDSVTIASPPVVNFTLTNEDGVRFTGLAQGQARFTLSKLVPELDGTPSHWQSYLNKTETPTVGPGTDPKIQAINESSGTLVNNHDGTYRYTFVNDVTNVTSPLAVAYEPTLTHRLGLQISGGDLPVTNATYDWRPSDGATTGLTERIMVQTASCNECHGKLALHGGGRIETNLCVTCHNPGSTDANSGNTVDFKVMIHKLHRGESLPSVEAGGEYAIWGFSNVKHDYSDVAMPQDIRNCTKCHNEANTATPQAVNWQRMPSVEACGSCHDDVNFATGEHHDQADPANPASGVAAQNGQCTICHSATGVAGSVQHSHEIPSKIAGTRYALKIDSVTINPDGTGATRGFPVVTYEVLDPTNGNARYNIKDTSSPTWNNSSVSIYLGWNNDDHTNVGNGTVTSATSAPASAISLNGKAASSGNNAAPVANTDGTFTVTSLRGIPLAVTGSGVAGMTGRAAEDLNANGVYTDEADRIPIKSVVKYFPITDSTAVARRTVVDIVNQCDDCHDQLTLHGDSRTDEPQVCVICHNPRNTDIGRRPKNGNGTVNTAATVDGLKEQSIDFKRMVHGIHASAKREQPFVVYGFNSSVNDFSTVRFPGVLNNCRACHKADTFTLPLKEQVLATTVDTGDVLSNANYRADQTDDLVTTRTTVVCSTCHDGSAATTHMQQSGGQIMVPIANANNGAETCEVCHGPGRIADVSVVHKVTP